MIRIYIEFQGFGVVFTQDFKSNLVIKNCTAGDAKWMFRAEAKIP
jgi:hypothetical protein